MSARRVVAIVVQYGDEGPCLECIESLRASRGVLVSLVVVDNGPGEGKEIERSVASMGGLYLPLPHNCGFAGGANAGIRAAQAGSSAEAIVLLNPDVRLHVDCLQVLAGCLARHDGVGLVGPALLSMNSPGTLWNLGGEIVWPRGRPRSFLHGAELMPPLSEAPDAGPVVRGAAAEVPDVRDVDFVCGSVLCMRPEVPARVGLLDEGYFLYFEDADFSYRARRAGFRTVVVPAALAWHEGGASIRWAEAPAAYYRVRNRLAFSRAWNPHPWRGSIHRFSFGLRQVVRALARSLARRDGDALLPALAVLDYLRGKQGAGGRGVESR